jgi:PAS domain S-box-containing protein
MRHAVERLSDIFDSLDYHVALYDHEWRYVYVNQEAARTLGRPVEALIGQSIWELFPGAVGNQYHRELQEARATGRPIHSDHFYEPFGQWFENHIYPRPDGVLVLSRDVTANRLAADAQRQQETMLRLAQRAGGVATFQWDFTHAVAHCSAEFFALFGLPPLEGQMRGAEWDRYVHPDDRQRMATHLQSALAGQEPAATDYRIITADGRIRWLTYAGQLHRTATGAMLMLGTVVDITSRKEIEEQLARANRVKDEFLATLSHELRTPLNVIRGRASMLALAENLEAVRKLAEVIERNSVTLENLVSDLLDVSRITLGHIRLDRHPVEIAAIVETASQGAQTAAAGRQIELVIDVAPDLPVVWGDSTRLQQVLWNLLNNAVKFTSPGGTVAVSARQDGEAVVIDVTDTGEGIPAEILPHIFDMFRQGQPGANRTHGGLGLGLSIARTLVELHGGTIRAESAGLGHGARFVIRLPAAAMRVG